MVDPARADTYLLGRHHARISWLLLGAALAWLVLWASVTALPLWDRNRHGLGALAFTPVPFLMGLASSRARKGVRDIPPGWEGRGWAWAAAVLAALLFLLTLFYWLLGVLGAVDLLSP
jgi:hypothetical protein